MAVLLVEDNPISFNRKLPVWFRQELPDTKKINAMKDLFRSSKLHTVCESARCPNMGECWGKGVATFMILGEICSRACRFCAVQAGRPTQVDRDEPRNVALAVKELGLRYVVITSVARDDLEDEGADQFVATINEIRVLMPHTKIEILIPDFSNKYESLKKVVDVQPEVLSHNIETVRSLSQRVRPQAQYQRSLDVLRTIKMLDFSIFTKSSIMLGLGEKEEEVLQTMKDLINVDCDILTIGQYLAPTELPRHLRVQEFITPEKFDEYAQAGRELGFKHVMSGPLVRSSYIAEEGYTDCMRSLKGQT